MSYTSGENINLSARFRRLANGIPCSYGVFKSGSTFYGETHVSSGTDYDDADATTVLQNVIDNGDCSSIHVHKGTYNVDTALDLKSNLTITLDMEAEIQASANLSRLLDARDCSQVHIFGGKFDGNGKATNVMDFSQTVATVTHNRVSRSVVCGARDIADSCLLLIDGNSGFQLDQPWLDGRVDAAGATDSAYYGIICDSSGGQNTLFLGDINNFFQAACIRLGGGSLQLQGGALEGGHGTTPNIAITSSSSGSTLRVFGTWMESNADNILISEGTFQPGPIDLSPLYMAAGGAGYANVNSTTTANHLNHLRVRGGTWVNAGGTYNLTATNKLAETALIDKSAMGGTIDTAKFDHYILFHRAGWGHEMNDALVTTSTVDSAGWNSTGTGHFSNNQILRWRNNADTDNVNVLKVDASDNTQLEMHDGIIADPKNHAPTALSGGQRDIEIDIGGTPYYFTVYPTKA